MSAYGTLDPILREILRVIIPLREDWNVRFQIIQELRAVVESMESLRGATVEPYGSFVSDLFSRWGDLDISIELPNGSHILTAGKKFKQTLLADILKVLRKKGGWRRLHFIANARVPILKCESVYANISCDISINNLSGQMKSKMLYWINSIDGRFREMVLLVKEWAKAHGINDPKSGSFNSYCLSLLVVFHFQTCVPAILPPLKEIYPGNMVDDLRGVRSVAEGYIENTCAENITKFVSDRSRERNQGSLCELFLSFLAKFSDISSWAPTQGICVYTGEREDIDSNMRWLPKTYTLFVEDPFEQPANTARTVSSRQLGRTSDALRTTFHVINSGNKNPSSLVPFIVRPQIAQLLPRTLVFDPNGGYIRTQPQMNGPNGGYIRTQPQMNGPKRGPSQGQRQTKNARVDKQTPGNTNGQRAVNASQNQEQQVWRPRSGGKNV